MKWIENAQTWMESSQWLRLAQSVLDILLVAFLVYSILRLIRGSRTVYMVIGLGISILVYWFSSVAELYTLNWILYHFLESLFLILIILFQNEIRRFLTRMGQTSLFSVFGPSQDAISVNEIAGACISLANKRVGALIVIEREVSLGDYAELGVLMDAHISKELLVTLFHPTSPLHDGAVIIQKGRISYVSCFLPLTMNSDLDTELGTRHRAAIGLSEETDALVIAVSEEKGWISVAMNGKITRGMHSDDFRRLLNDKLKTKISKLVMSDPNRPEDSLITKKRPE